MNASGVPKPLQPLSYIFFISKQSVWGQADSHFTDTGTKSQNGSITCPFTPILCWDEILNPSEATVKVPAVPTPTLM